MKNIKKYLDSFSETGFYMGVTAIALGLIVYGCREMSKEKKEPQREILGEDRAIASPRNENYVFQNYNLPSGEEILIRRDLAFLTGN